MVTLGSASDLCLHTQGSNCSCSDIVLLGQGSYAVAFMNVTAKWYDVMQLLMPLLLADGKEGGGGGWCVKVHGVDVVLFRTLRAEGEGQWRYFVASRFPVCSRS